MDTTTRSAFPAILLLATLWPYAAVQAQDMAVTMYEVDGQGIGRAIGSIAVTETPRGLLLTPALSGLSPGLHGFHVHENPSCAPASQDGRAVPAMAAGAHYDPFGSKRHGQPDGDGHLGDLPPLQADGTGRATRPVLAPRLSLADLRRRALVIHANGDNHADHPAPAGGGGTRIACGVID
ncbi:superoxide dismutase [Cu-Zn] SodC [Uliginosibacterium sp. H1]|uniref:superoxide dismutase [Cu-Zn] SodC n=1 Tax=Uliginosibacterium sp. H1 TaxID=3114757 RepID=UPI002E16D536|nr:superoxide dismutase [Cu-Zn] SodC [Uliginosibacterium sp. H1]